MYLSPGYSDLPNLQGHLEEDENNIIELSASNTLLNTCRLSLVTKYLSISHTSK